MKDCQGNEFGVGNYLASEECPSREPQIQCVDVFGDVAEFRWLSDGRVFSINQESLNNTAWVVVEEE